MTSPAEPAPASTPAPASDAEPAHPPPPAPKTADNANHDRLFRHAFSLPVVARQFLRKWLPSEMVAQTDWKTLKVCPISGINESLAERREDIVYRIKVAGGEVHFYILVEHQTKIDTFMAQRFLEETVLVWQQDKRDRAEAKARGAKARESKRREDSESAKLPLVVSMLLHPGPGKWGKIRRLADLIEIPPRMKKWARTFMPDCGFIVVELAGLPFEKLADGHLARAILGALQGERLGTMNARKISRLLDEFFADPDQTAVKAIARQLWTYLLRCSELKNQEIGQIVTSTVPTTQKRNFMSTAERLEHEGRLKGLEEGLERGLEQGREQGLAHGELIGRIQVMQEILGKKVSPRNHLIKKSFAELNAHLERLRSEHQSH
ncbi:MAG: Rpn family recombination-promoting nuclease/putative transposase [Opitutaceae bacterium]|jgi:predicted transposase YdaD|nr:Rpn family recombination-promoting nuclease/putative transposase [Opitutaceae bacterium]